MGGAIGSGMLKPQSLEQMQDVEGQPGSSGFWTLRYYQPLFDIDTIQVCLTSPPLAAPRTARSFPFPPLYLDSQGSNFFRGMVWYPRPTHLETIPPRLLEDLLGVW